MKHILCFGDSNTYGFIPFGGRYGDDVRWTLTLARLLGPEYVVHEEGQNARTTSLDDPFEPYKNALDYIIPCLESHVPLDLTILMLGTNDMKEYFRPSVEKITGGIRRLTQIILDVTQAPVLLVSPIHIGDTMASTPCAPTFPPASVEISKKLGGAYKGVAAELGTAFLDAADYAEADPSDCLHFTAESHRRLAEVLCEKIREMGI